jgi:hypothetical protein
MVAEGYTGVLAEATLEALAFASLAFAVVVVVIDVRPDVVTSSALAG